jgi:hypothetical protein
MAAQEYKINEDLIVFYIQAETFPKGIPDTFLKMENLLGSLKDRHVYGVTAYIDNKLVYRACVKENFNGEANQYGLPTYAIPKGKYLYLTLPNWRENLAEIPVLFDQLMALPYVKKQSICLEDYTSPDKMLAMVQKA